MTEENEDTMPSEQDLPATTDSNSMLFNPRAFEQAKQVAQMFAKSQLVPAHLQGKPADCFLAMTIANELGVNALLVMQNIVIIHGTAGWKAQWIIGRANRSGVFKGPISFDSYHDENRGLTVVAKGVVAETGEVKTASADMAMAQAEGWSKNSKYQSMPEQMLSYRAASFLVRKYCPEVLMGYQTMEELEDMKAAGDLRDVSSEGNTATDALRDLPPATDAGGEESPVTEDDSGSQEGVLEDPEPPATSHTETPQEPDGQVVDTEANGVPMFDGAGNNLGGYQRQGSWLNALIKLVTEAQADPKSAHAILHANADTIERIRAGGAYIEKLGQLDAMMQAIGDPADNTDDWIGAYDSASDDAKTDHDLYAELTDDLDSLVSAQDTSRIRDRLNRADDITDSAVRANAENELNNALQRAQP